MKLRILLLSFFIFALHAQTFDELKRKYINRHRCCILRVVEVANRNSGFAIPKPDLENAARELKVKGLEQFLSENEECAYYPQEERCLLYNSIVRFLNMPKSETLCEVESAMKKAEEEVVKEETRIENNHDYEMVKEARNRLDEIKKVMLYLEEFLELAKKTKSPTCNGPWDY